MLQVQFFPRPTVLFKALACIKRSWKLPNKVRRVELRKTVRAMAQNQSSADCATILKRGYLTDKKAGLMVSGVVTFCPPAGHVSRIFIEPHKSNFARVNNTITFRGQVHSVFS